MSLFGSIQLANNSLRANQIGLQVTGQNIANANTPGYIREEVIFSAAPTQRQGGLLLGMGVEVQAIVQKVDKFLEERLRGATSDRSGSEVEEQIFTQLESMYGELGDTDLSSALNNFFSSISEILNQPESAATRNLAVLRAKTLTDDINRMAGRAGQIRQDLDDRVAGGVQDANRLIEEIRVLNIRIAEAEGGSVSASDAVGLRDQRNNALTSLAQLMDITTVEQSNGTASVFVGGEYLVLDGYSRELKASSRSDRGLAVSEVRLAETDELIDLTSGELAGLINGRDNTVGEFLDSLNQFAGTLAFEFNKIFSSGQGINGYQSLTSQVGVDSVTAPLDEAGLAFTPTNGSFQIQVYNKQTQLTQTSDVIVDLNGLDQDTSLTSLAESLNAIDGISATIDSTRRLVITSDSTDLEFSFANDTSGLLAALGVNTLFVGSDASSLGINSIISKDPLKFATSRGGMGEDTQTAVDLAGFMGRPLASNNDSSLTVLYDRMTATITQGSTVSKAVAEGARVFEEQLRGQSMAVSGVSIDEEVMKMIRYQRSFQASAKYISTLDEMLEMLVSL